jgi:hypothetical protein
VGFKVGSRLFEVHRACICGVRCGAWLVSVYVLQHHIGSRHLSISRPLDMPVIEQAATDNQNKENESNLDQSA